MSLIPWDLIARSRDSNELSQRVLQDSSLVLEIIQYRRETDEFTWMVEYLRRNSRSSSYKWFLAMIERESQETMGEVISEMSFGHVGQE